MTKWKDEIDRYIGEEQKFTPELRAKILRKASKRSIDWRYGLTVVSFCIVVFILFLMGPIQVEPPVQTATPLEKLIEETTVEEFFISSKYSDAQQFFARDSSRFKDVHAFKNEEDALAMNRLLHDLKLAERPSNNGFNRDVLIVMANGEHLKLKIYKSGGWFAVQDVRTKLFYKLEDTSAVNYSRWNQKVEEAGLSFGELAMVGGAILMISYILKLVLNLPKSRQKQPKTVSWKGSLVYITVFVSMHYYNNYLQEHEYVVYQDLQFIVYALGFIIVIPLMEDKDKPRNEQIYDWIMSASILLFLWILFFYG
ncbi:hypothetical protein MKY27_12545 [Solibacillus sp. FSL R5-0449]|uniref:hypothetical protein n=1 Tax=Solibacillus sp. FSL R5-0449 TaxID=2921639 RepID=UPI0030CEBBB0